MAFRIALAALGIALFGAPAQATDTKAEIDFVTRASNANLFAIAESRLALDHATDPRLTAFARRMIDEHETTEAALGPAASGSGVTIPMTLDPDHQARVAKLRATVGATFDKAYVADQAENHSNALTLYADYMLLGEDAGLKAFATTMIPVAEAQFKAAQALSAE
ncbi:DUF4142 domain-containing protein [Lichenihabitans sp. PAMC28606]|uniref:DUF4142 domain-containing protein n=1 Tax=Lichenihabitans sp. PAMC28606 TaxID=2880932 RepID=UPI001D0AD963|nr:DUF4142 domain-containing protein [Lichenihabitans sp. PAMC28606]UDL95807.1 DUF4142 domain-containing protein [Lichenihabitans sp. PAMC28606]